MIEGYTTCLNCGVLHKGEMCNYCYLPDTSKFNLLRLVTGKVICSCNRHCFLYLKAWRLLSTNENWVFERGVWTCGMEGHTQVRITDKYYSNTMHDSFDAIHVDLNRVKGVKGYTLFIHGKKRLKERYGITFTHHDFTKLEEHIRNGNSSYLGSAAGNKCVILGVRYEKTYLFLVWDSVIEKIITFLPPQNMKIKRENKQNRLANSAVMKIIGEQSKPISKVSNVKGYHEVMLEGTLYKVLYNKNSKTIEEMVALDKM